MLLGTTALLWAAAGSYAGATLRGAAREGRFAVWWLMTLVGNLGVFIAADLVTFYLFFTLSSLAAYGLVVHDDTSTARRAAAVYIGLAVLGEALLLIAFVLLAAAIPDGSLLITDAMAALPGSPWRDAALAFLILGFGLKIGLVPLHVWMPLTYSAAPIPAAAVLSGAAVKVGVIGLIRFMPFAAALPGWGEALAAIGLISTFYGVAIGLTQNNPKTVLAYSSVSQMGLLATVLGMGLAAGDPHAAIAAAFYAMHHVLVKGGLFLAVGVAAMGDRRRWWVVLLPAAVLSLSLAGLPLTGGALAKSAVKNSLGNGLVGPLATLSSMASTVLMLHFLHCLMANSPRSPDMRASIGLAVPWLVIAFVSIVVPWMLFSAVTGAPLENGVGLRVFWDALWPILAGGLVALLLRQRSSLIPSVPEGDVLALASGAARALRHLGAAMERTEAHARQWPVAGVLLLAVTTVILVATILGRH